MPRALGLLVLVLNAVNSVCDAEYGKLKAAMPDATYASSYECGVHLVQTRSEAIHRSIDVITSNVRQDILSLELPQFVSSHELPESGRNVQSKFRPDDEVIASMQDSAFGRAVLPHLTHVPCIIPMSELPTLWLVYHDEVSKKTVESFAAVDNALWDIRGLDNGNISVSQEQTSRIIPALGSYHERINEMAAIIALGFGINACSNAPRWVGTAGYKAISDNGEPNESRKLPNVVRHSLMRQFPKTMENELSLDTVLYWYGTAQADPAETRTSSHNGFEEYCPLKEIMLTRFFREVLDIDLALVAKLSKPDPGSSVNWPWKNWFITSPTMLLTLAKLHALLFSWIDARYPFKAVGCSLDHFCKEPLNSTNGKKRCWSYMGELATIMLFTNDADLHEIGCNGTTQFHAENGHTITDRISSVWEAITK